MSFTKADLIDQVYASNSKMSKARAREAVETFLLIIKSSLEKGDDILLSGFGKFNVKDKNARRGRNPQTGDELVLNARRVLTFNASGKLKKLVNDK